ncbi:glycine--tRNA ligase [Halorientalis regularis]|jgi:glycyl-tRNA synthetase|uniref:glycine--tRNA ligase n=1 Tax=Halorientalis regularis TaxID=660518 RepID=A0A1G7JPV4_9EURY|nr:glycine--tRNA ligase [Halorientalis regularis]SDF26824.1 glycyl-tRNA synthetase [Halorientalis regularis]
MTDDTATDRLTELAKRRGFFFQSSEAYGGVSGFYVYGPEGATLKENLEDAWRDRFVRREGHMEIEAPNVMPEPVFEASGHLDGFDDMIVECPECGASHRADHIVEDNTDIEEAESIAIDDIEDIIAENDLVCPSCGTDLAGEPVDDFNLMFETNIGPGSSSPGYLRPETAQGIFVEFPRLKEYARGQLPFGVAQVGAAYRNEISPRKGLVRLREFAQAELEHFVDPEADEPDLESVEDVAVTLYSEARQDDDGGEPVEMTVGEAVEEGIVGSAWVGYYLGVAQGWYERIGIDMDRFRFRQHRSGELAHYAADCWDAEADTSPPGADPDWIEITGFAYRGDYDLTKHGEYADDDFTIFKQYDDPITVERATVDPDMSYLGPEFGGDAGAVADALEALAERDRSAFEGDDVTVDVDGEEYTVPVEKTGFAVEEVTEAGEHVTPHVVEPSFGVDRLVYTVLAHSLTQDDAGESEADGDDEERTVLTLPPELAPTTVAVFPLMDKDGLGERAGEIAERLRRAGFEVAEDASGSIGRRYRRQDEVGTPYCVTVDYDTLDDDTVTIRDRDTTAQARVPVDDLPGVVADLRAGETTVGDR